MINIRGDENRKKAVEKYELEAVSHLKLLNGQTIESSAGSVCRDRYYIFNYKPKNDDSVSDEKIFYCGYSAAEKLLELLGEAPLPLFNPLTNREVEGPQVRLRGDRLFCLKRNRSFYESMLV